MTAADAAKQWNDEHPVGTKVKYWAGVRHGTPKEGQTRSFAYVAPNGIPVVFVTGQAGYLALSHVEPV